MAEKQFRVYDADLPPLWRRLRTLDELEAPYFTALECPACSAPPGEPCPSSGVGAFAHQARIDRAFRIAYEQEEW